MKGVVWIELCLYTSYFRNFSILQFTTLHNPIAFLRVGQNSKNFFSDLLLVCFQTPPNFLVQSDLRSYVTPVVILPPEDTVHHNDSDNVVDGNLVDTSDANSLTGDLVDLNHRNGSVSPDVLAERQVIISHME